MPKCDVCGNEYDKTILVVEGDRSMTFGMLRMRDRG
jgi:hypothetical protein